MKEKFVAIPERVYDGSVTRIRDLEAALQDLVDYTDISKRVDPDAVTARVRRARVLLGMPVAGQNDLPNQSEIDTRIQRMTYAWVREAETLCKLGLESSALVLASVLQLTRFVLTWQPQEMQEEMRTKAISMIATHGTSVAAVVGRMQ